MSFRRHPIFSFIPDQFRISTKFAEGQADIARSFSTSIRPLHVLQQFAEASVLDSKKLWYELDAEFSGVLFGSWLFAYATYNKCTISVKRNTHDSVKTGKTRFVTDGHLNSCMEGEM